MAGRARNTSIEVLRLAGWVHWLEAMRYVPRNERLNPDLPHHNLFQGFGATGLRMEDISAFRQAGGSSNKHDIEADTRVGDQMGRFRIEMKGETAPALLPPAGSRPWTGTPQLVNPTLHTFPLAMGYARLWYDKYIPLIRARWPDLPAPPVFEAWVKQDGGRFGASSAFGLAAKVKKRENEGVFKGLAEESLRVFWRPFIQSPQEHKEEWQAFERQLEANFHDALSQKDAWLVAIYANRADLEPIEARWYPSQKAENFRACLSNCGNAYPTVDLFYTLVGQKKEYHGEARLCWGNGNGISNIRWHVK
ncbi:MAG: hypothetical protein JRE23_14795 [Deltaproteobacteria bacterium]|nr:hypothetical protein [Deltaproteobacteria bacterium]